MHRNSVCYQVVVALCALFVPPAVWAQSLQVTRADGSSTTVNIAQITVLPHVSITAKDHDTPAQFDGVPLAEVLKLAGIETGGMKGRQMTQALLIEAADGYKVVFALAEVDADFATREVLLADKRDGKALDDKQGHSES